MSRNPFAHVVGLIRSHLVKSEDLGKAISSIPKGAPEADGTFNYDHALTPEHRSQGYSLRVGESAGDSLESSLLHHGKQVGAVIGDRAGPAIHPHAELNEEHQGKGLGTAMYEALYAHAFHNGIQYVAGGDHTLEAGRVHESLARKHGLDYVYEDEPNGPYDPDDEDEDRRLAALHYPRGRYGYQLKSEGQLADRPTVDRTSDGEAFRAGLRLEKAETNPEPDEVAQLLRHPDPRERALALKLDSVAPHHLAQAALDPDPVVWRRALQHPASGLALAVLARSSRDAAGNPVWDRHDEVLRDPRCTPAHVDAAYSATRDDPDLPLKDRVARMALIAVHPMFRGEVLGKAISDIQAGRRDPSGAEIYDYSHLLSPENRAAGYEMSVHYDPDNAADAEVGVTVRHPGTGGKVVYPGLLVASARRKGLRVHHAMVAEAHRGRGLGTSMYEAIMAHARSQGAGRVYGGKHSTGAHAVHEKLATRHGLGYAAKPRKGSGSFSGDYDEAFGPYSYSLKSEWLGKGWVEDEIGGHPKSDLDAATDHAAAREDSPPQHEHVAAAFAQRGARAGRADDPKLGIAGGDLGASPKAIFSAPMEGHDAPQRLLVKPASWSEGTSQALYHAGEVAHLHQKSVRRTLPGGHPVDVVHLEAARPVHRVGAGEWGPDAARDGLRIGLMDFLQDQDDRHTDNLMVRPDGSLMVIDNADGFQYADPGKFWKRDGHTPDHYLEGNAHRTLPTASHQDAQDAFAWWKKVSPDVKRAFRRRLGLLTDPQLREKLQRHFESRAAWLDQHAAAGDQLSEDWERAPYSPPQEIKKAVDFRPKGRSLPKGDPAPGDLRFAHEEVVGKHPPAADEGARHYHEHVGAGKPELAVPEVGHKLGGAYPKQVFNTGLKRFIVKQPSWEEHATQALYHAAGVGHLVQKSHVAPSGNGDGQHHTVVEMEPDLRTVGEDQRHHGFERFDAHRLSPEHSESARRIFLMDMLTGNDDRHEENLMLRRDGSPVAIDHGDAFAHERELGADPMGLRFAGDFARESRNENAAYQLGGEPTPQTWAWYDSARHGILKEMDKQHDYLVDPKVREEARAIFAHRVAELDRRRERARTPAVAA